MHLPSALLALAALAATHLTSAQILPIIPDTDATSRTLNISLAVTFGNEPESSSASSSPIKITNGIPNPINIALTNYEETPVSVRFLSGSLWKPDPLVNVRNLTQQVVQDVDIENGKTKELGYVVNVDMHPQELLLNLQMILEHGGKLVTATAWNQTVQVVEQPMSLLDPQLFFLYLILLSGVAGAGYWGYNKWLESVNPKKRREGPRPALTKKQSSRAASPPTVSASGIEKKFDESWIPEHHMRKPQQRK